MSPAADSSGIRLDEASAVWDTLAERVESFLEAWSSHPPPRLADFVPDGNAALRRLVMSELVKVDLEQRWRHGREPKRLEAYAVELPELADGRGLPADLIYEEYHVRRQSNDEVSPDEYFERFPDRAEELRRLLGLEAAEVSTALISAESRKAEIEAGERIDEFDLLVRLGQGAFATVFLARQQTMQRLVAVKISADKGREPETLAQLDHPYIVRVFDQRRLADRGLRLLYMQYVAGGTLADVLARFRSEPAWRRNGSALLAAVDDCLSQRGESPPDGSALRQRLSGCDAYEMAAELGLRLAEALDYAHDRGVLHRDLKPANIMVSAEGAPKLVDFNISFCSQLDGATPAAYFGGSLAYMGPEQLDACNPCKRFDATMLDGRSDVYALGVVLWELVTGRRPFPDETLAGGWSDTLDAMSARRRMGVEADVLQSDVPRRLRDVLIRSLAPDPNDRFATAGEMARALRLCLEPEVEDLLHQETGDWRATVRRWVAPAVVGGVVLPNAAAGLFNYAYNFNWMTSLHPGVEPMFRRVSAAINVVAFSLGILLGLILVWPLVRAAARYRAGESIPSGELPALRRRCLRMSHYAALIGIAEWLFAGPLFPIVIHGLGVQLRAVDYVHFSASLALCGLIAASYPFFLVTFMLLRAVYPVLLEPGSLSHDDQAELARLARRSRPYLYLAAALPLLGVLLLVVVERVGGKTFPLALLILSAGGVVALGPILWLAQRIQRDTELLGRGVELLSGPARGDSTAG